MRSVTDSGHYYLQIRKVGMVFTHNNCGAFHTFHVKPQWVTNFLQGGKITADVARLNYIQCCMNVKNNLAQP